MGHRLVIGVAVVLVGMSSAGGWAAETEHPWVLKTRLLLTGAEATSDPAGVTFYSAVTLEATLTRSLSQRLSAEVLLVNASHEVTTEVDGDLKDGSLKSADLSLDMLLLSAGVGFRF